MKAATKVLFEAFNAALLAEEVESDSPAVADSNMLERCEEAQIEITEAGGKPGSPMQFGIYLIKPGWGATGLYKEDVLRRDIPTIFPKGTQMFWNHDTKAQEAARPVGDLTRLAAVTVSDPVWDGKGMRVIAEARQGFGPSIKSLYKDIGVSIRAGGIGKPGVVEGRTGTVIEQLTVGRSVDFVTRAGAGGAIIEVFEAAVLNAPTQLQNEREKEKNMDADLKLVMESLLAGNKAILEALQANTQATVASREAASKSQARSLYESGVRASKLPEASKTRLLTMPFMGVIEAGALNESATLAAVANTVVAEAQYLKSLGIQEGKPAAGATPGADTTEMKESDINDIVFESFGIEKPAAKPATAEGVAK
jgi:hypothetical protein